MSGKVALTFLAGLAVGLMAVVIAERQPQALAQQPEKPLVRWEYKVEVFPFGNAEATKRLNELADEGWEYVGLVGTARPSPAPGHEASVAFRRPKK